jgi:hypothetical protein
MTNPIAKREDRAPVTCGGTLTAIIPQDIDQAFRLAQALSGSGDMIPKAFQPVANGPAKTGMIMAAILKGMEVGLAPMQALSAIAIVNGRPTIWGDALRALVLRAGHFIDCDVTGEGIEAIATATITRSSGKKVTRTFSMKDAKVAGLMGKAGPWTQYPTRMLMNRATAFAVRDGAADALMGMAVTEEVSDYGPDAARDVTPAPRRGGPRFAPQLPEPEDDEPEPVQHDEETGEVLEDGAHAEWIEDSK